MQKGPLVYAAVGLALILMAMSFAIVLFPEYISTIGIVAGVVAIGVVIILVMMLIKLRRSV